MKKLTALLLTMALLLSLLPAGITEVRAAGTTVSYAVEGGYIYFDASAGTITGCGRAVTVANIPSAIEGVPVTAIGDSAFYYCDRLTSITIPDSVTSIGDSTFSDCYALTSITIPDSVTPIGDYAFYGCYNLTSITIPDSVTSIGDSTFSNCYALRGITIPDSVTSIGDSAFYGCYNLTSITIPDGVTTIGDSTFSDCYALKSITIPDSVTSIGDSAFSACNSLSGIWVQEGNEVFSSDTNGVLFSKDKTQLLQCPGGYYGAYTIPDSVTAISDSAFYGCGNLTSITIPDSVTAISDYAFYDCDNLTSITIPDGVTTIGDSAFSYCYDLASITIPDSVTTIGNSAFSHCSKLASITIPDSVTAIGKGAFYFCSALTSITFPDSVTTIGDDTFCDCHALTSITIPDSVTTIGEYAFYSCSSLIDVYYSGTEVQWNTITIQAGNGALQNATIHCEIYLFAVEGGNIYFDLSTGAVIDCDPDVTVANIPNYIEGVPVTAIGDSAFSDCNALTSITIPDGVTTIGDSAFSYCSKLTSITIPDSVTAIGNSAFCRCVALTSITIPDDVTTIGNYAFCDCDALTSITIGEGLTTIGDDAFTRCDSLSGIWVQEGNEVYCSDTNGVLFNKDKTKLLQCPGGYCGAYTIPDGVTTIGDYAFYCCSKLTSITIPDSVTTIGDSAFLWCESLGSITIPDNVTTIGDSAFFWCESLRSITIPDGVTTIGNSVFSYCSNLTSITIPDSVTAIGNEAFYYCSELISITIPDSVTTIGDSAFKYCYVTDVYYSGTEAQWKNITIMAGNEALQNATIHYEPPHDHVWDAGKITTAATCVDAGVMTYTCTVCGGTMTEAIPATGKHVDANKDNKCDSCGKDMAVPTDLVAIYNVAHGNVMTTETSVYTSSSGSVKDQLVAAPATLADGILSTAAENVALFKMETNDAGITTFITEDGKYLEADGTNIRFVDAATENTEFILDEVEGGYYIRLANFKYQGFKDQYVEYYIPKNVYSCYGMGSDTSMYIFNFYPVGNEKPHVCTWDNGVVTKEATCEATGTKTYTCTDCGATKEETIPTTDHSYEITYSVEADCKWTGVIRYTCSNCRDVKTEILPALGHSFDSGTVTTPATCTEEGVLTYTCEGCGETKTEAIPTTDHSYEITYSVEAECNWTGAIRYACSNCGDVKTETLPALGHSFDSGTVTTPATCTTEGVRTYACSACGETKTEPIPATGHLYVRYSNNGPNHSVMCVYCRNIYTEAHNFTAGDCICGAAEPAVDGSIQISHTLNLASDIAISYVIVADSLSGYDSYYMECVTPVYEGNTLVGSTTHILEPELRGSYYYFILDGLTSLEMNDTVEARLYMTKAGKSYTSEPDHYSIATYAYNKLNNSTTAQDLKTVCANLLQYGSKAQLYKEYRTDALADGEMTAEHRSYLTDPTSVAFGNNKSFLGDHSAPTVTFVGAPLRLDSKIIVRYVIDTTAYKGNMEDLSLRVSYEGIDGSIVTETLTDLELYYEAASYYAFDFDGLLASELRTVMSAVVYEGDTPVSETMTYSVDTYGNGRTGSLLTLIQAMMAYSDSCKVYFE